MHILILSELKLALPTVQRHRFYFPEKESGKDTLPNVGLRSVTVSIFQGTCL